LAQNHVLLEQWRTTPTDCFGDNVLLFSNLVLSTASTCRMSVRFADSSRYLNSGFDVVRNHRLRAGFGLLR
jgi:hypothetical protein